MLPPIDRRSAFGGLMGLGYAARLQAEQDGAVPRRQHGDSDSLEKLKERPSVRDKGAKGDGATMDGAAVQDALRSFDTIWVPPGIYMIDVPLTLPSYCVLEFASQAIFCPAHDGMTVFKSGEVSYASRLVAPRVHARGKRNITAFELTGFRHRAEIQHADIKDCTNGIILKELCWDTLIHMPWIRQTSHPIIVANGSNAVDIFHPSLDDFEIGVRVATGPQHTTTSVRIWGGYIQNGRHGVVDEGCFGTIVDGTYFEGLREGDIVLTGAIRPDLSRTQHYGDTGRAAIRMMNVDGATVFDPVMTSGSRKVGLYDIDRASKNVSRFETTTTAGVNQPIGNVGGSGRLVREDGGDFKPSLDLTQPNPISYQKQEGRWLRAGNRIDSIVELSWAGAPPGGELVIVGMPAVSPMSVTPRAALAPVALTGHGNVAAYARLLPNGQMRIVTLDGGREKMLAVAAAGSASFAVSCLL